MLEIIKELNMKNIRKYISLLAVSAILFGLFVFTSCTGVKDAKIKIVCTAFAQYDFTMNILGERADEFDVVYLLESGNDMHSYSNSLSVSDKVNILSSELFICIGGESEKWVEEILEGENTDTLRVLYLIDNVGKTLCHEDEDHTDDTHAHECDEHIWLSPKRALLMCDAICDELCVVDPENAEEYKENCKKYTEELKKLDSDYENLFESAENKYLLFADRFPFLYLTSDYSVSYSAAFDGCSTETGASFETVKRLVSDINKNNVKTLLTLEKSALDITPTLIKESGRSDISVESVDSMQNVGKKEIENGFTYLGAMQKNLEIFGKAMN